MQSREDCIASAGSSVGGTDAAISRAQPSVGRKRCPPNTMPFELRTKSFRKKRRRERKERRHKLVEEAFIPPHRPTNTMGSSTAPQHKAGRVLTRGRRWFYCHSRQKLCRDNPRETKYIYRIFLPPSHSTHPGGSFHRVCMDGEEGARERERVSESDRQSACGR